MDESRNMGLASELTDPAALYVRKFRWTLESEGLPEHLIAKVQILFKSRIVRLYCYEISHMKRAKIDVQDWSEEDFSKKTLTLTTYDGCGSRIYRYKFHNLKVRHESLEFDYADSDPVLREFHIHYGHCEREVFQEGRSINPKEDTDEPGRESGDCPEKLKEAMRKCL